MPGAQPTPPPDDLTQALAGEVATIAAAWTRIEQLVDACPDPPTALVAAGRAADAVAALVPKGAALRGRQAIRWRDRDRLSLASLGDELDALGLGREGTDKKGLAAKLVRQGAPTPEGEP
jgi:hypothetical protein